MLSFSLTSYIALFTFILDIVQSTFLIAGGASLEDIGLVQENIIPRGVAMQCRITTEDPGKEPYARC
jgi:pyruvate carboxylase